MKKAILTGALGALAMYLFDPQLGRTRRAKLQQQLGGLSRRAARDATRKTEYVRGQAEGLRHLGTTDSEPENDAALTAKIESEVLSRQNYPKGQINVNAAEGIVEMRGVCDSAEQVDALEADVRKIKGVVDVHNYLHLASESARSR